MGATSTFLGLGVWWLPRALSRSSPRFLISYQTQQQPPTDESFHFMHYGIMSGLMELIRWVDGWEKGKANKVATRPQGPRSN